jgi:hypothetical protein
MGACRTRRPSSPIRCDVGSRHQPCQRPIELTVCSVDGRCSLGPAATAIGRLHGFGCAEQALTRRGVSAASSAGGPPHDDHDPCSQRCRARLLHSRSSRKHQPALIAHSDPPSTPPWRSLNDSSVKASTLRSVRRHQHRRAPCAATGAPTPPRAEFAGHRRDDLELRNIRGFHHGVQQPQRTLTKLRRILTGMLLTSYRDRTKPGVLHRSRHRIRQ